MSTYEANKYNFTGANVTGIPTSAVTSGTFADARFASSNITQHVDLTNLSASNLTSGTVPNARYGTPTFNGSNLTNTSVASTVGSWSPGTNEHSFTHLSARYVKVGRTCSVFYYGKFNSYSSGTPENNPFYFTGLPFTSVHSGLIVGGGYAVYPSGFEGHAQVDPNSTNIFIYHAAGNNETNSITTYGNRGRLSKWYSAYPQVNGINSNYRYIYFHVTYITAS